MPNLIWNISESHNIYKQYPQKVGGFTVCWSDLQLKHKANVGQTLVDLAYDYYNEFNFFQVI